MSPGSLRQRERSDSIDRRARNEVFDRLQAVYESDTRWAKTPGAAAGAGAERDT